ncbi:MAG: DJ-1/PfpI family protein [Clostridia bacterium]|nr:DJ-1/PfpI family protein [Clostridia bacterium]
MIAVLLADGFEEIEALTPVDMLRRAGKDVKTVGISGRIAHGSHGIDVICDITAEELDINAVEMAVFPGGMPGALNLDGSELTDRVIASVTSRGGHLAAICAAPLVLGRRGLLDGRRATCYPGFENELKGATVIGESVVTDGNITTAKGMGVSLRFAEELIRISISGEKAAQLSATIMEN